MQSLGSEDNLTSLGKGSKVHRSQEGAGRDESEAGRPFVVLMFYPEALGRDREVSHGG